jgi:hypothetical protein
MLMISLLRSELGQVLTLEAVGVPPSGGKEKTG